MTTPTDDEVRALVERLRLRAMAFTSSAIGTGTHDALTEAATMLSRLLAERAEAQKAEPMAIKPLEWRECPALGGRRKLLAFDCFGNEFCRIDLPAPSQAAHEKMAVAQADYEARIRSAFVTPPTDPQKVRDEALEEARRFAKVAWLACPFGSIADADTMNDLCEYIADGIRALKSSPADTTGGEHDAP